MSKYKGKHGGKKGQKIRARPPPFSGNARKKSIFLMGGVPLQYHTKPPAIVLPCVIPCHIANCTSIQRILLQCNAAKLVQMVSFAIATSLWTSVHLAHKLNLANRFWLAVQQVHDK